MRGDGVRIIGESTNGGHWEEVLTRGVKLIRADAYRSGASGGGVCEWDSRQ